MRKRINLILACLGMMWLSTSTWSRDKLPEPLALEQALSYAAQHPRSRLNIGQQSLFPRRPSMYLDCHSLAYTNVDSIDNYRNHGITRLFSPPDAQGLEIMQRFFDVLLADLSSASDNENMAVVFVTLDRARNRHQLGEYSELRVVELEAEYQIALQQRAASETSLRLTRSLLAQAINHPASLSSDLLAPELSRLPAELPKLDTVFERAQKHNDWLKKLQASSSEADKQIIELELRQQLLELLLRLQVLKVASQRTASEIIWRDLKLEHSRALYEQEVKADLGDSMSQQTRARLQEKQVEFCQALAWSELNALQGLAIWRQVPRTEAEEK